MTISYIPKKLDDLVGLKYLKRSLGNFDYDNPVPIMFVGERGCGKSSLSQIIAAKFCTDPQNIKTINCAYYRKIDDMRREIDNLAKASLFGKNKVLILDEVHQLSKDAQSAWLTPLEPQNLKSNILVIACTTTIEKLLPTFLRRFVQYKVQPLTEDESIELIKRICELNNVTLPKIARSLIVEKCEGIPGLILNGVRKLVGVKSIDEAKSLIEIAIVNTDEEIFEFFKLLLNPRSSTWNVVKKSLSNLLTKKNPEEIRIALLNLISSRLMSDFFKGQSGEGKLLVRLYDNLKVGSYPEKANLIYSLYKSIQGE